MRRNVKKAAEEDWLRIGHELQIGTTIKIYCIHGVLLDNCWIQYWNLTLIVVLTQTYHSYSQEVRWWKGGWDSWGRRWERSCGGLTEEETSFLDDFHVNGEYYFNSVLKYYFAFKGKCGQWTKLFENLYVGFIYGKDGLGDSGTPLNYSKML